VVALATARFSEVLALVCDAPTAADDRISDHVDARS
jgi:hypothetical protein